MTPMLLYDIEQAGLHDQFWLFLAGSLFSLLWFSGFGLFVARMEQTSKATGYIGLASGLLLFCVISYFLVQGWLNRRACISDFSSGNLEVTTDRVTHLKKQGKTPPFRYEFMLGKEQFIFGDSPSGVCGLARPPSGMLFLEEGQILKIEHRGFRVYRVLLMKESL